MAEEKPPPTPAAKPETPARVEKQAPSDRQSSGEKPPSRPPNGSRKHKGKGDGEGPEKAKSGNALMWILLALALAVMVFIFYRCQKKDPGPHPPAQRTVNVSDESFYKSFLSSLDFQARAKAAFYDGQKWMTGAPESRPETTSTKTMPQSPLFKAATQFSFALEQFKYGEELIKSANGGPIKEELKACRDQYLEALELFQSTAKLYNDHAKAKYQESNADVEKFALSDANARWALGEKLMTDFLLKGCDGDLFRYLNQQKPEMRQAVLAQYRNILGANYDKYRVQLEGQLGVPAASASPAPSQVPAPSSP